MIVPPTNQDWGDGPGWIVTDGVCQLRLLGTYPAQIYKLAPSQVGELVIGSLPDCAIQLIDPAGLVSRRHASLQREGDVWLLRDLGSMNGIRQDDELRLIIQLAAGVVIEIGGMRLIAESPRLIALRALLARVIGWTADRAEAVDRAVQATRQAAIRRTGLLLCGMGALTGVARRIHDHTVGADRPFIVCAEEVGDLELEHATTGTLCLVGKRRVPELGEAATALRLLDSRVRTTVCAPTSADVSDVMAMLAKASTIELPALSTRRDQIGRILGEYAEDAVVSLDAPSTGFREHEYSWLLALDYETLADVEETALRVVAIRNFGIVGGAARLGITHGALSIWASRRKIPT